MLDVSAKILYDVDNILCQNNGAGLFFTILLSILDKNTCIVECVNVSHKYPVIGVHGKLVEVMQKDN